MGEAREVDHYANLPNMTPAWLDALVAVLFVVGLSFLLALLARRMWLNMLGGLFDCALRSRGSVKWRPGLARYSGEYLEWYRIWHPWPRPTRAFVRDEWVLASLRDSDLTESKLGYATAKVVVLRARGASRHYWELALNEGSAMGLVSWLESAPPGQQVGYRSRPDS